MVVVVGNFHRGEANLGDRGSNIAGDSAAATTTTITGGTNDRLVPSAYTLFLLSGHLCRCWGWDIINDPAG